MEQNYENEIKKAVQGVLHWNYRKLTSFPEELQAYRKSIFDIYMKGNLISKIPTWIANFESLMELHLCENQLVSLPAEISLLKSLQVLDISRNKITKIPESLTSLKSLNVFCADENSISYLPISIGNMKALRILSVAKNQLKYVPESIYFCVSLEEVILDYNALFTIPFSLFHLTNLKVLSLHGNAFVYLPSIRPMIAEPRIILGPTETDSLKWLTYDVLRYIMEDSLYENAFVYLPSIRPIAEPQLIPGPTETDSLKCADPNREMEWLLRGYSTILVGKPGRRDVDRTELRLPFSKPYKKEVSVPTLYELCMRFVHNKLRLQIADNNYSIRDTLTGWKLPETIKNDLHSGPSAYCQICRRALFKNLIIRIYDPNHDSVSINRRTKIILCFCSSYCSKRSESVDLERNASVYGFHFIHFCRSFTELDWTT